MDNLKPTEIVVSFSSLSRWPDPPALGAGKEESKANLKRDKTGGGDRDSKADVITESSSIIDGEPLMGLINLPPVVNQKLACELPNWMWLPFQQ